MALLPREPPFLSALPTLNWLGLSEQAVSWLALQGWSSEGRSGAKITQQKLPKIKVKTYWALLSSFSLPFVFYILNPHFGFSGQSKLGCCWGAKGGSTGEPSHS